MKDIKKDKLLNCPFCNSSNIGCLTKLNVTTGRFGCKDCGASINYYLYASNEKRNEKWNTRAL